MYPIHHVVNSEWVTESAVLNRRMHNMSSILTHAGSWFSIFSFHNDSYSQFYEKVFWHAADAYIITVVTTVNTTHIDYNVRTNGSDFIICKMTKCREAILKNDLKRKLDWCAMWTKSLSVFCSASAFSSHMRKCHWKCHYQIDSHLRSRWQE